MNLKLWFNRKIRYRFNRTGRFIHALEFARFKKLLGRQQFNEFVKLVDRQQYVPHRRGVALEISMNPEEPYSLWSVYDFVDTPNGTGLAFSSIFISEEDNPIPGPPEEIEDYAIFEVQEA